MQEGEACGDATASFELEGEPGSAPARLLAIVDGLGHGAEAALASSAALALLAEEPALPLAELFARLDARLAGTRGAAVGLVRVAGRRMSHLGVGNTRVLRLRGTQATRLPSCNGIVGGGLPARLPVNELDLESGDWLLMFSDGLQEMLQLPVRLPEWERDPATLCAHLLRHWRAGRDDAGVLVMLLGED